MSVTPQTSLGDRISQLEHELNVLRTAQQILSGVTQATPSSEPASEPSPATKPRRRRSRKPANTNGASATSDNASEPTNGKTVSSPRGRAGQRGAQALELLEQGPRTIPEIGKELGIEPNYLYRVLPKLQAQGKVTVDDSKRWSRTGA